MFVRRETPADHGAVRALTAAVASVDLLDGLRASDAWLPALSFVALGDDGEIVAHVGATRGRIGDEPALVLLPPSVDPDQRGRGVGQALMHTGIGAAEALGESLAGLVVSPPEYYTRFGFRPAEEYSITAPVDGWQPYFVVRRLTGYDESLRGTFVFPDPFLEA